MKYYYGVYPDGHIIGLRVWQKWTGQDGTVCALFSYEYGNMAMLATIEDEGTVLVLLGIDYIDELALYSQIKKVPVETRLKLFHARQGADAYVESLAPEAVP